MGINKHQNDTTAVVYKRETRKIIYLGKTASKGNFYLFTPSLLPSFNYPPRPVCVFYLPFLSPFSLLHDKATSTLTLLSAMVRLHHTRKTNEKHFLKHFAMYCFLNILQDIAQPEDRWQLTKC